MNGKYKWRMVSTNQEMSGEEVTHFLLEKVNGIVLLDGFSGCGKTTILESLRMVSERPVHILSYENVVNEMLRAIKENESCTRYLLDLDEKSSVIGIEDIDYLSGKEATQEGFSEIIRASVEKHLVILTGSNLKKRAHIISQLCVGEAFIVANEGA